MAHSDHLSSVRLDSSRNILNITAKRLISIKSRAAFTNIGSVGVRAGSTHVTRVISFTFVNIWENTYVLYYCHFKNGRTLSRVITLIIINNKTKFPFLCVSQIRCFKHIFHCEYLNLTSWQLWNNWLVPAAPTKQYYLSGGKSSQNTGPNYGVA